MKRLKKILVTVLAVMMICTSNGVVQAAEYVGTALQMEETDQEKIIKISSELELQNISKNLSGNYELTKSITLTKKWTPLGNSDKPFTGTFNGNGHVIRKMDIDLQESETSVYAYYEYTYVDEEGYYLVFDGTNDYEWRVFISGW